MITDRTNKTSTLSTRKGAQRGRVWIEYEEPDVLHILSAYPEDARKFALELLRVAEECSHD